MKRGSVSKDEYPGITFVAEHFYGYERQIQVRYVVGSSGEYHTHDYPQFYYCVSGSFSYIADMCGFGSVTYFGKCYKKYRGYTPKEERAALEELRQRYSGIRISHEFFEPEETKNPQKTLDKPR